MTIVVTGYVSRRQSFGDISTLRNYKQCDAWVGQYSNWRVAHVDPHRVCCVSTHGAATHMKPFIRWHQILYEHRQASTPMYSPPSYFATQTLPRIPRVLDWYADLQHGTLQCMLSPHRRHKVCHPVDSIFKHIRAGPVLLGMVRGNIYMIRHSHVLCVCNDLNLLVWPHMRNTRYIRSSTTSYEPWALTLRPIMKVRVSGMMP